MRLTHEVRKGSCHGRFGYAVFVLDDPVEALRLQLSHLQNSCTPLPILLIHPEAPARAAWQCLPQRLLVFWSPRGNPQIEEFAALAGCDAWSIESPDRSMAPEEMLLQVMHQAGVHLPDMPPAAVTDTDVTLDLYRWVRYHSSRHHPRITVTMSLLWRQWLATPCGDPTGSG